MQQPALSRKADDDRRVASAVDRMPQAQLLNLAERSLGIARRYGRARHTRPTYRLALLAASRCIQRLLRRSGA